MRTDVCPDILDLFKKEEGAMNWMLKRSMYVLSVVVGLNVSLLAAASANTVVEAACQSLSRPNIDCVCVAKRVETYQRFSPTPEAKDMITQTYLREVGLENDFEASVKAAYGDKIDPMKQLSLEMAMEPVGGTPTNIEHLESGCVIKGASPIAITPPRDIKGAWNFSSVDYVDQCMKSVGSNDDGRRYCQCSTERLAHRLTDREFEANFRSFSQTADTNSRLDRPSSSREEDFRVMARAMGVSLDAFKGLIKSARQKIDPFEEQDTAYCSSRLWADQRPGQSADARKLAGFDAGILMMSDQNTPDLSGLSSGSKREQATAILANDCSDNGNSDAYCACYMRDFDARIVAASPSDNATLAFALMTGGGSMPPMDYMTSVQSVPQSDHEAAAMLRMSVSDLGDNCSQGEVAAPEPLQGTPAERMTAICIEENENEALCQCMTGQLESKLSPDDFELIVDIREADAQGADDPLAKVAQDRGLSKAEAEEAMVMNRSLMGGMMGMDLMACMGGMPSMPAFPGGMPDLQNIPGMPRQ
jgi:hypothetical protein